MVISNKKLFKFFIGKNMTATDLWLAMEICPNTLTELSKNEYVSMEVLVKVCRVLDCDFGNIMEIMPTHM